MEHADEKNRIKVLYMEDEEFVADIGRKMLEATGLTVDVCKNGEEALALFNAARQKAEPYRFAILDILISRGMGGIATLQELHKIDRAFRAIATSGCADSDLHGDYAQYGFTGFLPKPFLLKDVRKAVAALLDLGDDATAVH